MRRRCSATQRGRPALTMAVAILLLALVSVALVSVAQLVRHYARRTFNERTDAQLRLYVMAAMEHIRSELAQHQTLPAQFELTLPDDAGDAKANLSAVKLAENWDVQLLVAADGRELQATCTFASVDGAWRIADSRLGEFTVRRPVPQ